jgi:transposase-like protein
MTFSAETRAEAVALAASIGPVKAARQLGLNRTTVQKWCHRPAASPIIAAAEARIADRLKAAHEVALQAVLDGLHDPRSRLGDRAQALRVLGEQLALAEGRATSRTESMSLTASVNAGLSEDQVADVRDAIDAFLRAKDAGEAIQIIEDPLAELDRPRIGALIAAIERRLGDGR